MKNLNNILKAILVLAIFGISFMGFQIYQENTSYKIDPESTDFSTKENNLDFNTEELEEVDKELENLILIKRKLVSGYKLEVKKCDFIEKGLNAYISIEQNNKGSIEVSIQEKNLKKITFDNLKIRGNIYTYKALNTKSYSLSLDNPKDMFFFKLDIFEKTVLYDIAFTHKNVQYCFNGIQTDTKTIEKSYYQEINPLFSDVSVFHSPAYKDKISLNSDLNTISSQTTTNYGLAFEAAMERSQMKDLFHENNISRQW